VSRFFSAAEYQPRVSAFLLCFLPIATAAFPEASAAQLLPNVQDESLKTSTSMPVATPPGCHRWHSALQPKRLPPPAAQLIVIRASHSHPAGASARQGFVPGFLYYITTANFN
jgi:hypothetical protein